MEVLRQTSDVSTRRGMPEMKSPWKESCDKFKYKSYVPSESKAQKHEWCGFRRMAGSNDSDSVRARGDVPWMGSSGAGLLVGPILQSLGRYCDWANVEFCFYRSDICGFWSGPVAAGTKKP